MPAKNPWNTERITGGSSSGSAAAVAAGICVAALGTDTAGSIRCPAALCGIVGHRPSAGLLSTEGIIPLSRSFDTAGPMTHTVRDAAVLLEVLSGAAMTARSGRERFCAAGWGTAQGFLGDLTPRSSPALRKHWRSSGSWWLKCAR